MADVVSLAQDYYDTAICDAEFRAALLSARKALILGTITGGTYGSIVNASKNGASYTIRIDISTEDRRNALKLAANGLNSGVRPSRTYHARF